MDGGDHALAAGRRKLGADIVLVNGEKIYDIYGRFLPAQIDSGYIADNDPLYPALARGVMVVTHLPWQVAAPLLSTVLAGGAMLLIHRCIGAGAPRAVERWPGLPLATVALVCAFPTSPVLQTASPTTARVTTP